MKRSELFNLVWSEPMLKLASRFGITDRGLAKVCSRNNIPVPTRGYWGKLKAGQYPVSMALPRPDEDYEIPLKVEGIPSASQAEQKPMTPQEVMQKLFYSAKLPEEGNSQCKAGAPLVPTSQELFIKSPAASAPGPATRAAIGQVAPTDVPKFPFDSALDLEAECQRAMAAGMEYQRRQAAQAFLGAVVANAYTLDEPTSSAVLNWARAVHKRLSLVDPVGAFVNEIRAQYQ